MDLNGFLREMTKVDIGDPANRRWGWVVSYLGQCLDIPRAERTRKIRALVFPGADGHKGGKTQLTDVECAILVATLPSHAEAAAGMASAMVADPSTLLSCALIVTWEKAAAPRLAGTVALFGGRWTGNLAAFLSPVEPTMVEAAPGDDDSAGQEAGEAPGASAEEGPLVLDGQAWLIAINESDLIGDLVGVDLPVDAKRHPLPKIAADDWLALTSLETSEPPGVFCIARVATVTQRATSTIALFDRVHVMPVHTFDPLTVEHSTDFSGHRAVAVPTSDIGRMLKAAGVTDPGRMLSSPSRLTADSVRDSAPGLILPHQTILACTSSLASGRNLILRGEPGTGKSTLAWALADAAQRIGLLPLTAQSVDKNDSDRTDRTASSGLPPNPFDYRPPDYRQSEPANTLPPGQGPVWAILDDLTASQAVERCERAFKAAALTDDPAWGSGRVIVTTCMSRHALAEHLGPATMHRFAVVEIEPPRAPADWSRLIDIHGQDLPRAARERLLELAESGAVTPGALIDLARQVNCLLVVDDGLDESAAEALLVTLSTYGEGVCARA